MKRRWKIEFHFPCFENYNIIHLFKWTILVYKTTCFTYKVCEFAHNNSVIEIELQRCVLKVYFFCIKKNIFHFLSLQRKLNHVNHVCRPEVLLLQRSMECVWFRRRHHLPSKYCVKILSKNVFEEFENMKFRKFRILSKTWINLINWLLFYFQKINSFFNSHGFEWVSEETSAVSNDAEGGEGVPSGQSVATGEVSQGNKNPALLTGSLYASPLQHRPAPLPYHVHLLHRRHVRLHARQAHRRHRRHVQLRKLLQLHDHPLPDLHLGRLGRRVGRPHERQATRLRWSAHQQQSKRQLRQQCSWHDVLGQLSCHHLSRHHQHVHRRHPRKLLASDWRRAVGTDARRLWHVLRAVGEIRWKCHRVHSAGETGWVCRLAGRSSQTARTQPLQARDPQHTDLRRRQSAWVIVCVW